MNRTRTTAISIQLLALAILSAPSANACYWGLGSASSYGENSLFWPVAGSTTYPLIGYGVNYAIPADLLDQYVQPMVYTPNNRPAVEAASYNGPIIGLTPPVTNNLPAMPMISQEQSINKMPIADGFINSVNQKYHGDLGLALQDKELYSWAKALKVVGSDKRAAIDLSMQRKQTIAAIIQDNSLDSKSKLDALKILVQPIAK